VLISAGEVVIDRDMAVVSTVNDGDNEVAGTVAEQ